MLKLTVIGAVLVAATSASVFRRHFSHARQATPPPRPQEILEEYADALERANVTDLNDY